MSYEATVIDNLKVLNAQALARMRESRDGDGGLIDLGPGVPRPDGVTAERVFSQPDPVTGLLDLGGGVPCPTWGSMREGSFGTGDDEVYVEGPETLPALRDLSTVMLVTLPNGTPNLENEVVKRMCESVERGHALAPAAVGKMKELLVKHAAEIKALRASPDRAGQDYDAVPDPATGRRVTAEDRAAGLLRLDGVPAPAAA